MSRVLLVAGLVLLCCGREYDVGSTGDGHFGVETLGTGEVDSAQFDVANPSAFLVVNTRPTSAPPDLYRLKINTSSAVKVGPIACAPANTHYPLDLQLLADGRLIFMALERNVPRVKMIELDKATGGCLQVLATYDDLADGVNIALRVSAGASTLFAHSPAANTAHGVYSQLVPPSFTRQFISEYSLVHAPSPVGYFDTAFVGSTYFGITPFNCGGGLCSNQRLYEIDAATGEAIAGSGRQQQSSYQNDGAIFALAPVGNELWGFGFTYVDYQVDLTAKGPKVFRINKVTGAVSEVAISGLPGPTSGFLIYNATVAQ